MKGLMILHAEDGTVHLASLQKAGWNTIIVFDWFLFALSVSRRVN